MSRKRPSSPSREVDRALRSNAKKKVETDYLSSTNTDCLLAICSFLPRSTLNELECASRGLFSVVNNSSLRNIKSNGHLYVYEEETGHSLRFNFLDEGKQLLYHIRRGSAKGKQSMRTLKKPVKYTPTSGSDCTYRCLCRDPTSVPVQIFENLETLNTRHHFVDVALETTLIDNAFVDRCETLFASTTKLFLYRCNYDDSLDFARLVNALVSSRISSLKIEHYDGRSLSDAFCDAFGEQFVSAFASANAEKPHTLVLDCFVQSRWTATAAVLPALCRFKSFNLPLMNIAPPELFKLVMMKLDERTTKQFVWHFKLTEAINETKNKDTVDQHKYRVTYKYMDDIPENWVHEIGLRYSSFYCELTQREYTHGGTSYRVTVRLLKWQEEEDE